MLNLLFLLQILVPFGRDSVLVDLRRGAVRVETTLVTVPTPPKTVTIGPSQFPPESLGSRYNLSVISGSPATMLKSLEAARKRGGTVVIQFARNATRVTSPDTLISVAATRAYINSWPDISSYVRDGTVYGVRLSDDITGKEFWGPNAPYLAQIDSFGLFTKDRWPDLRTFVRATPTQMLGYNWKYVDGGWAQYSTVPRLGPIESYIKANRDAARQLGICVVWGLNTIGNGLMPADSLLKFARAFLAEGTPILNWWTWDATYENNTEVKAAFVKIRQEANNTIQRDCR